MNRKLRVLVGCEYSGTVREAFRARGWEAWSADFLPTDIPSDFHFQGDVRQLLASKWDLAIFHPNCQYLANSSAKHLYNGMKKENGRNEYRWRRMKEGAEFFYELFRTPCAKHVAVENPIMLGCARDIIGAGPTQVVQPWMFGHQEIKATCLWLRDLPPLVPTNNVKAETMALTYAERAKVHWCPPGPDRWKIRSKTLPGLAAAMAGQWGGYLENLYAAK